jgi:hypothetical protein
MERPALWKALALGAAIAAGGVAGAGAAVAGCGIASADVRPAAVAPIPADWQFDDPYDLDDLVRHQVPIPKGYFYLDDDWFDDWFDH